MNWLSFHDKQCSDNILQTQLYRLIKIHKPSTQKKKLDRVLSSYGHTDRLQTYHPNINPIEVIWSQVTQCVASSNVSLKTDGVKLLCEQTLMR